MKADLRATGAANRKLLSLNGKNIVWPAMFHMNGSIDARCRHPVRGLKAPTFPIFGRLHEAFNVRGVTAGQRALIRSSWTSSFFAPRVDLLRRSPEVVVRHILEPKHDLIGVERRVPRPVEIFPQTLHYFQHYVPKLGTIHQ